VAENKAVNDKGEKGAVQNPVQAGPNPADLPAELAEIVKAWPNLPKHIRQAISALVQTAGHGLAK